ncbi:MAG: hypothetical protein CML22_12995 [Rheinheimera sp.]|nr:hypothetical protein [Rheinheimera sp.]MBM35208.1 hypothetical protein [Rheinheimera sp.]HAW94077.1 hypothetical protein [Candidatus Azambacteria bacterium]
MNINLTDLAYAILLYTLCSSALMALIFKMLAAKSYKAVYQNIFICIIFVWYQPFHMLKHCMRTWKAYRLHSIAT